MYAKTRKKLPVAVKIAAVAAIIGVAIVVVRLITLSSAVAADTSDKSGAETYSTETIKDGTTNLKKTRVISGELIIPEKAVYYVRKGGKLYINDNAKVTVKGKLKIAAGGAVYVRGKIISAENSRVSVMGKMKLMKSGSLSLDGILSVNPGGLVSGSGTIKVNKNFSDIQCIGTVTAKIKAPAPIKTDGITTVGGVILANKQYDLPADYAPELDDETYAAFLTMKEESGFDMSIVSGYRSYETQKNTFAYWVSIDGEEEASRYSARPGQSEHQTGLAIDISSLSQSYADTAEGIWLAENCHKYGFIIRYPKDGEAVTGYIYEPWHVRYLGKSTAKLVHDSGLMLEEFFCLA